MGPVLAVLAAGALGCSTTTPPAPPASATPASDDGMPASVQPTVDPGPGRTPTQFPSASLRGPRERPSVPAAPDLANAYRFVSAPDFLNQDVADLTADGRRTYVVKATGEVANSTNESYETALTSNARGSRSTTLSSSNATPPASICMAVDKNGDTGVPT